MDHIKDNIAFQCTGTYIDGKLDITCTFMPIVTLAQIRDNISKFDYQPKE